MKARVEPRRPKLADRLVASIRKAVAEGTLRPGAQLPTEGQLCTQYNVSRTVVREAVARLAADGLVTPRQGAGVFVNDRAVGGGILSDISGTVATVLNVLEVRMAVEIEAAALAALRRSASQEGRLLEAFNTFEAALRAGRPTGSADFDFHRAIAEATNNPFYVEILELLGRRTIPRDLVTAVSPDVPLSGAYQRGLQAEHQAILTAISDGDADAAREAMRSHLSASRQRYNDLLREGGRLEDVFAQPVQ